MVQDQMTS